MSPVEPVPTAVVYDANVLVTAVASGNSPFRSWPSPPPTSGNACADCVGIVVDAAEFELPRVFRTGNPVTIYAAACISSSSSMTSCGVLYPSVE